MPHKDIDIKRSYNRAYYAYHREQLMQKSKDEYEAGKAAGLRRVMRDGKKIWRPLNEVLKPGRPVTKWVE